MRGRLGFSAAMAALATGLGSGVEVLQSMFTPQFRFDREGYTHQRKGRKNRHSGTGSKPRPRHNSDVGCGAKEMRKNCKNLRNGDCYEYVKRMAWNKRNAHVIAKRELDQLRARSPLGGRNAIIWGRR